MTEARRVTVHQLKAHPEEFVAMAKGQKRTDLRREVDRHFMTRDLLMLEEWDPDIEQYTGRHLVARVTHVIRHGDPKWGDMLAPNVAALSILVFREPRSI